MADLVEWVSTERVGQLTGPADPQGWTLLNGDTRNWSVVGVDLGANADHEGRTYFFFGDVANNDGGRHQAIGWNFFIPNDHQGASSSSGQGDWRFCQRCRALFWADRGSTAGTVCARGGEHYYHPESWVFFLPNDRQGATPNTGQSSWWHCGKCGGLFFARDQAEVQASVCPAGGSHDRSNSWQFFLPNDQQGGNASVGQPGWNYCGKCHGLCWFGASPWAEDVCPAGNPGNADLVAWTDDPEVTPSLPASHQAMGWEFYIPSLQQNPTAVGQRQWRFCSKCHGLFWANNGSTEGTVCPRGGQHWFHPESWEFVLPNDHQGGSGSGQGMWWHCWKCGGLFFADDGAPQSMLCPTGQQHDRSGSWQFFLPNDHQGGTPNTGQPGWRFCVQCHALFWAVAPDPSACPHRSGGGIHLHPVMKNGGGEFDPFATDRTVGLSKSLETPGGPFFWNGRSYVFINMSPEWFSDHQRPGEPMYGTYLASKPHPEEPGAYRTEFLFSPRVGLCPRDEARTVLESHEVLGFRFVLPHDLNDGVARQANWRRCRHCASLFFNAEGGRCWATGAKHEAESPADYGMPLAAADDVQYQDRWFRCGKCDVLFWNGDTQHSPGRCPVEGVHRATGVQLFMPYAGVPDTPNRLTKWRYCGKCAGLFWGDGVRFGTGVCPGDAWQGHEAWGLDFALPYNVSENDQRQTNWRHCVQCSAIFWGGAAGGGACPRGGGHTPHPDGDHHPVAGFFAVPHDGPVSAHDQPGWRFCSKCAELFWPGHPTLGVCARDHAGHDPAGITFALPHFNPGTDRFHEGDWRFCVRCFQMVWTGQSHMFLGVTSNVVSTDAHKRWLPRTDTEQTLVMPGFGFAPRTAFRLACLPLRPGSDIAVREMQYYTGSGEESADAWSPDERRATPLLEHNGWTSTSASWQSALQRWVLLYSDARDDLGEAERKAAAFIRIAPSPMQWHAATPIPIFDPVVMGAYRTYMHLTGKDGDDIHLRVPPLGVDNTGWAYGLYLLDRYTRWDPGTGLLDIYYLLSLSVPYQIQLMHTRLHVVLENL